ncbi:lysophospholipid acyltransferase family protein [Paludisphaera mucosa]|uniref:Lysophospholipid acyltransferase family protein n=1 Tax=Paludisphaera mucosa TaxID=3030827 RepID=A0ABT6F5J7_9BACT|nr:lysophospholipid acyltransferase family protein [Paludisphaera mucosa]MDG3002789.1 lysophospholipid acyltransferase family protein [Paludisphaera mucosa]
MTAWVPIGLTAVLLLLPRLLGPGRRPSRPAEIGWSLMPLWWLARLYTRLVHGLRNEGWAPLPEHGPAILIANHTCCVDHLLLQSRCRRVLGFMIAREMYELPIVHRFCVRTGCIPVNRDGRDIQATRAALRALEEGRVVPIFPEGRITPESGRALGPVRSGAAFIAVRSGAVVVPAFISGTPPTIEIGPALWTPSDSRVVFGDPIDLSDFSRSQAADKDVLAQVCERFQNALRELQTRSLGRDVIAPDPSDEPAAVGPVE